MYPAVPDIDSVRILAFTRTAHASTEQTHRLITRLPHLLVRGRNKAPSCPGTLSPRTGSRSRVPPANRRLERFEPLKAVGGVTPVLNADLRGQKPMRRFRSPQGPALRAGQFSAAALWQAPCGKEMKGMRNRAFASGPPQKTPSEAPHRLLLADPRRKNR
jgi:hypothetical protein